MTGRCIYQSQLTPWTPGDTGGTLQPGGLRRERVPALTEFQLSRQQPPSELRQPLEKDNPNLD